LPLRTARACWRKQRFSRFRADDLHFTLGSLKCGQCPTPKPPMTILIQICSGAEWRATKPLLAIPPDATHQFPYGEYFRTALADRACVFFYSRRTKTRAAGACQYAIDRWEVDPVFVLGTCGGVAERLRVMDVVFATRTIQYDCHDQRPDMGLTVSADLSWLSLAALTEPIHAGTVASADRNLTFDSLEILRRQDVLAADWESGAIAAVCSLNRVRWAVFRAVSDLPVAPGEEDARRQLQDYSRHAPAIMEKLLGLLPQILAGISWALN
jgi:nucleoside phosphorylase